MGYPSVFGGQWVAANFAYGSPGGPAALICQQAVSIPASPLAAASMTLAFSFTVTIDGITFWPLNANAPVNVVGVREHGNSAVRGLKLIGGPREGYPLIGSVYQHALEAGFSAVDELFNCCDCAHVALNSWLL